MIDAMCKKGGILITVLIIMCIGVLIGFLCFPQKWGRFNSIFQIVCTGILIFCMGGSLGSRPNFFAELSSLGIHSLAFALVPIACSVLAVYFLTEIFMKK